MCSRLYTTWKNWWSWEWELFWPHSEEICIPNCIGIYIMDQNLMRTMESNMPDITLKLGSKRIQRRYWFLQGWGSQHPQDWSTVGKGACTKYQLRQKGFKGSCLNITVQLSNAKKANIWDCDGVRKLHLPLSKNVLRNLKHSEKESKCLEKQLLLLMCLPDWKDTPAWTLSRHFTLKWTQSYFYSSLLRLIKPLGGGAKGRKALWNHTPFRVP